MKKFMLLSGIGILALSISACGPKATKDECASACGKFVALQKAANPSGDVSIPEIDKQLQELQTQKAEALQVIDQELQTKLAELDKQPAQTPKGKAKPKVDPKAAKAIEEGKAKLNQEYAEKKSAKEQEFSAKAAELQGKKQKAEEAKKATQEEITSCTDKCVADGVSKKKADCQANAATLDDFNKCQ